MVTPSCPLAPRASQLGGGTTEVWPAAAPCASTALGPPFHEEKTKALGLPTGPGTEPFVATSPRPRPVTRLREAPCPSPRGPTAGERPGHLPSWARCPARRAWPQVAPGSMATDGHGPVEMRQGIRNVPHPPARALPPAPPPQGAQPAGLAPPSHLSEHGASGL